ncbi:MAG: hypothetical protein ACTSRA_00340 [Promethearchaeota archaeon]|nr:MAG: hypothetical protein [Helarchaeota virus Nidhogg Meg22_1012]URC17403.1 MAG: hypothetical protein [Helarchaeota virus Nidhogg Meg22_1214]
MPIGKIISVKKVKCVCGFTTMNGWIIEDDIIKKMRFCKNCEAVVDNNGDYV